MTPLLRSYERLIAFLLLTVLIIVVNIHSTIARYAFHRPFSRESSLGEEAISDEKLKPLITNLTAGRVQSLDEIRRRPLAPEVLLAFAESSLDGDRVRSRAALEVASTLGWRVGEAQAAILLGAIDQQQWDVAAVRIIALAKLNSLELIDVEMLNSQMPTKLAERLSTHFALFPNEWLKFADWLYAKGAKAVARDFFSSTFPYSSREACSLIGRTSSRLASQGEFETALRLIKRKCDDFVSQSLSSISINEHFGQVDRGLLEWQLVRSPNLDSRLDRAKQHLILENSAQFPQIVATKYVDTNADFHLIAPLSAMYVDGKGGKTMQPPVRYDCVLRSQGSFKDPHIRGHFNNSECRLYRASLILPPGEYVFQFGT